MDTEGKIALLVRDHFHWGNEGYPSDPGSDAKRREQVVNWLRLQTRASGDAALALVAGIQGVVEEARGPILDRDGQRFFARIDGTQLAKSPESILDKMVRDWEPDEDKDKDKRKAPPIDFDGLSTAVDDMGRFRVVVNFLSDLDELRKAICRAYAGAGATLSPAQHRLFDGFILKNGCFKDTVNLVPAERQKGERCLKAAFIVRNGGLKGQVVELQLETQLQEAWDKKDHFLIYEPRRQGRPPLADHEREIFAISELLFVADLTFDRLRKAILPNRTHGADHETS